MILNLAKEYIKLDDSEFENLEKKMLEFHMDDLFKFLTRFDILKISDLEYADRLKSQMSQKLGSLKFTENQLEALKNLIQVYHTITVERRFLMAGLMANEFTREECVLTVTRAEQHYDTYRVYQAIREFDQMFGTKSCLL